MEANSDPRASLEQMQQASQFAQKLEITAPGDPSQEQEQAREKMGALIDKLDRSVKERGVIAQVVGDKDETGDYRAAILTEPIIRGTPGTSAGITEFGYVALTPDGPMIIDGQDSYGGGQAVARFMNQNIGPEDYPRQRDFLKDLKYVAAPMGSMMTYRLEGKVGFNPMTVYMQPPERSRILDVNVEAQFDKSIARAEKPLEGARSQAVKAAETATTLSAKF